MVNGLKCISKKTRQIISSQVLLTVVVMQVILQTFLKKKNLHILQVHLLPSQLPSSALLHVSFSFASSFLYWFFFINYIRLLQTGTKVCFFLRFFVFKRKKAGYQSIRLLKILNLIIDNVKNNLLFNINSRVLFHLYNLSFSSSARTFVKEVSRFPDLSIHIKSAFPE